MFLVYYDEVEFEQPIQPAHWFGGIAIHANDIYSIEAQLSSLAKETFGSSLLSTDTEFHAKDIFHGKKNFKGRDFGQRLAILDKLLELTALPEVHSIFARVEIGKVRYISTPAEGEQVTFMYFVEKVDEFLQQKKSYGMLIGDYDEPNIGPSVPNLSQFRASGTKFHYGREIRQLVDTVHFAKSHHSRLIQLADVDLYCRQFLKQDNSSSSRKALLDLMRKHSSGRFAKKYKDYPKDW